LYYGDSYDNSDDYNNYDMWC